jgi:hypothetical protein
MYFIKQKALNVDINYVAKVTAQMSEAIAQ